MPQTQLILPLAALLEACRSLHEAARDEASFARAELGRSDSCAVSGALYETYVNLLQQAQIQFPLPFILAIPRGESSMDPRTLPALTGQLLAAIQALAAPLLTPDTILKAWDNPADAVYDSIEG